MLNTEVNRHQIMLASYDDLLSPDSEIRSIDVLISIIFSRSKLSFNDNKGKSHTGRPAYSIETMMRIFIYGYLYSLTSSRKLEKECKRNIEIMWLTGHQTPDHNTISNFRANYKEEIKLFSRELRRLVKDLKLIGNEYAIDGTKIKANVNRSNIYTLKQLKVQSNDLVKRILEYITKLETQDKSDNQLEKDLAIANKKREQIESRIEMMEEQDLKSFSSVDNDARLMRSGDGTIAGYNFQGATETKNGFIMSDTVTQDQNDFHQLKKVTKDIKAEVNITSFTELADKGYCSFDDINEIESNNDIECFVAVPKDTSAYRDKFIYDYEKNRYICPEGKVLKYHQSKKDRNGNKIQVYQCKDCLGCKLKPTCSPKSKHGRMYERYDNEEYRKKFKQKMKTKEGKRKIIKRSASVEKIFGTIKVWAGKIPILTRGIDKVATEIKLYCLAYNVRRLINLFTTEELIEKLTRFVIFVMILLKKSRFIDKNRLINDFKLC